LPPWSKTGVGPGREGKISAGGGGGTPKAARNGMGQKNVKRGRERKRNGGENLQPSTSELTRRQKEHKTRCLRRRRGECNVPDGRFWDSIGGGFQFRVNWGGANGKNKGKTGDRRIIFKSSLHEQRQQGVKQTLPGKKKNQRTKRRWADATSERVLQWT